MVGIEAKRNGDQFYYMDFPDLYKKWLSRGLFSISVIKIEKNELLFSISVNEKRLFSITVIENRGCYFQ